MEVACAMLKQYKYVFLTAFIVLSLTFVMHITKATSLGFAVSPVLPDNQRNNGSTFLDLLVTPGQEQDISIIISNSTNEDISVLVETVTASTNRNGDINYTPMGAIMDVTLKNALEDIAKVPESHYNIPANANLEVPIRFTIPKEPFDGIVLGSIRVLREPTEEERAAAGSIVNQMAFVNAVRLVQDENAEDIPADFELGHITAELINFRAGIVANIRNTQPKLVRGARSTAKIFPQGSDEAIFERVMDDLDFAPNSIFPFSLIDEAGYGIEAGDYSAIISVTYQNETWNFEQDFSIEPWAAATVNEGALNQETQQRPMVSIEESTYDIPQWAIIGMVIGVLILIGIIVLIIKAFRKKPTDSQP